MIERRQDTTTPGTEGGEARATCWHALWTHSNCERLVHDQLDALGFEVFCPEMKVWKQRGGRRVIDDIPLFPGYLFLRGAIGKAEYLQIVGVRGLTRILGERWDRLATVPAVEIESVRKLLASDLDPRPHPYFTAGRKVRIVRGPLAGAEGRLVERDDDRGLLVVSVALFQRSVSVEVDCTLARPV